MQVKKLISVMAIRLYQCLADRPKAYSHYAQLESLLIVFSITVASIESCSAPTDLPSRPFHSLPSAHRLASLKYATAMASELGSGECLIRKAVVNWFGCLAPRITIEMVSEIYGSLHSIM